MIGNVPRFQLREHYHTDKKCFGCQSKSEYALYVDNDTKELCRWCFRKLLKKAFKHFKPLPKSHHGVRIV